MGTPFARLWWDETVPTVLTFPTCHSQQYYIQSKTESSLYENVQDCKGFLIIIDSVGRLRRDIVKLEMQLQSLLRELWDMLWDWQFESSAGMNHS
ncbi:DNA cytosine-5-methyltransferase 2 [Prunus dulcis]|uniref:DNA cytosine-5-methyltransferase 2 n=1 Tax=Prunus dulcis TaxID=3755 RepID=A0A4Y1RFU7_PRUDU|nr:DNA cytosine-5-methyltransferase 2 [Prunus dulcis]